MDVTFAASQFPPLALGFFGLGVGYLIWGPQELFGFPAGSAVQLRSPDGQVQRLDLDGRSRASSGRLARGDYQLKVQGPGISWWMPVSLSRDQVVATMTRRYVQEVLGD